MLIRGASGLATLAFSGVGTVRLFLAPVCGRRLRHSSRVGFMPFVLFNSRQHRRVLVISSQQSFSRHTTYISSGILQKPTSDYSSIRLSSPLTIFTSAHTSHSKTQAEGRGT